MGDRSADCEIEVDECLPTPCQNNTECVDLINDFHCECGIGFTGYFCEVDIDLCTEGACGEHSLFCTETEYGHNVNCTCESGYTGSRCEENIDDCQSRPCKNGAICLDHINAYQCYCVDGYAGSHCEVNFDECGSSPCLNNGTCVDGLAQFICFCVQGFEGKECQINIDDCSSNPCSHNGTCHDGVDSFVCDCPIPYQGVNCSLLPCDTEPCLNDGVCESNVTDNATAEFTCTCLPGFDGVTCELSYLNCMSKPGDTFCNGHGLCVPGEEDYHCLCEPGYAGKDCQQPADYCTDHDCRNNATCVNNVSGYQCLCGIGWEGALCEREGNECEEWQPCSNGSTCVDLFNDYRCECAENWTGKNCTVHLNPCKSSPCPPSATCVDRNDIFRCICPPFLTGEMCDTVFNPCSEENNPCQNEAVCIVLTTGIAQCLCAEGFTGARCEVNIDDCVDDPCQNNGTCEDLISQYRCHCVPGYHGDNCEINTDECEPNPCKNGSTCYDLINQYKCECVPGFRSRHCDVEIDFCAGRPCSNNATCKSDPSGYLCICLPFFTGIHCETELDYCKPQPCQNNGTCHSSITGYACVCSETFTGMICADQIDYCQSEPCLNNGTCVNENNSYVCHCVLPYAGDTCENVTDFCDDNQCQNGGLCFSSDSGFNCSCPEFWTGKTCDSRIDFCERQPCFNEAVCENMLTGYLCHCVTGFTGDNCENKTFPCRSMPCQNNGTCAEEDGQFICSCSSGYKGVTCSEPITACVTEPCLNNATCLPSGQSYRCLCPIGFTGSICENGINPFLITLESSLGSSFRSGLWGFGILSSSIIPSSVMPSFLVQSSANVEFLSKHLTSSDNSDVDIFLSDFDIASASTHRSLQKSSHEPSILHPSFEYASDVHSTYYSFFSSVSNSLTSFHISISHVSYITESSQATIVNDVINKVKNESELSYTDISSFITHLHYSEQSQKETISAKSGHLFNISMDNSNIFETFISTHFHRSLSTLSTSSPYLLLSSENVSDSEKLSQISVTYFDASEYRSGMSYLTTDQRPAIVSQSPVTSLYQFSSDVFSVLQVFSGLDQFSLKPSSALTTSSFCQVSQESLTALHSQIPSSHLVSPQPFSVTQSLTSLYYLPSQTFTTLQSQISSSYKFSQQPINVFQSQIPSSYSNSSQPFSISHSLTGTSLHHLPSQSVSALQSQISSSYFISPQPFSVTWSLASLHHLPSYSFTALQSQMSTFHQILDFNHTSLDKYEPDFTSRQLMSTTSLNQLSPELSSFKYLVDLLTSSKGSAFEHDSKTSHVTSFELILSSSVPAPGGSHSSASPLVNVSFIRNLHPSLTSFPSSTDYSNTDVLFSSHGNSDTVTSPDGDLSYSSFSRASQQASTDGDLSYNSFSRASQQASPDSDLYHSFSRASQQASTDGDLSYSSVSRASQQASTDSDLSYNSLSRASQQSSPDGDLSYNSFSRASQQASPDSDLYHSFSRASQQSSPDGDLSYNIFSRASQQSSTDGDLSYNSLSRASQQSSPDGYLYNSLSRASQQSNLDMSEIVTNKKNMFITRISSFLDGEAESFKFSKYITTTASGISSTQFSLLDVSKSSFIVTIQTSVQMSSSTIVGFSSGTSVLSSSLISLHDSLPTLIIPSSLTSYALLTPLTLTSAAEQYSIFTLSSSLLSHSPYISSPKMNLSPKLQSLLMSVPQTTKNTYPAGISDSLLFKSAILSNHYTYSDPFSYLISSASIDFSHNHENVEIVASPTSTRYIISTISSPSSFINILSHDATPTVAFTSLVPHSSVLPPITSCSSYPCGDGGICLPDGDSYVCICPPNSLEKFCRNALSIPMFQFLGDGLLWYQEVDILPFFGITFNFNTTKDMGTLLYAMNENDADDHFLHLYIESGFLKYEFSCIVQTFDISTHLAVSDGHITTVTIVQNANCLSTLEVRTHLATFPLFWNVGSSNMPSRFHFTAVSDLFIGGIPNIVERLANFTGCLGDIVFDGIFPLPTDQSVNVYKCGQDISPPPSEVDLCEDIACQNRGTCRGRPSSQPVCDCPLYFTGPRCQQEITIYFPSFNGNSYLIHRGLNFSTSTLEILLSVKTTHSSGTVLFTQSSSEAYIHLHIDDGVPRLQMSCDDHNVVDLKSEVYINTGELIIIMLRLTLPFEENRNCHASLVVGNNIATSESYLSFGLKVNFEFVYLAGIPQDVTVTKDVNVTNFIGCIREFQIGTDEIDIVRQAVEGQNIVDCEVPACSYQPCSNGDCYEDGESWYCDCYVGYGGSRCERKLCQTNICQHGGTCIILEAENEEVCLCSLGRGGVTCQDMVSITMPSFSGNLYGYSSFMTYSTIPNSHNRLEVKFQFNLKNNSTSMKDNLVLFIADTNRGMESDYMAVGIYKQYLVLSYNLGSGNIHIWSPEQINPSMALHNVHFGRHNQAGWMLLDDQHNVSGQSPGQLSGLNGELGLYVGGFESLDFNSIPLGARFLSGFQGCIFNLMVKSNNAEFISPGSPPGVALMGRNIQQCEGTWCQTDLCHNGATCIELGSSFYCNCTIRWKGTLCMDALDSCNIGHDCADGATCIPKFPTGHICSCPLGKRGQQCEEAFVISDPVFVGERSFMALPSLNLRREANIAIQFKPYSLDGLLFYIAQHLSARSGDFLAISLNHGFLELRYNLGSSQTTVLKSVDKVSNATDTWYTAGIVRNLTHGLLSLGNNSVSVKTKPGMTMLDTISDFFLGGLPDLELLAPSAVANEPTAFEGCVRELIVNSHLYELNAKGALYGRDVNDCDGTGCGHAVCQNSGSCLIQSDILDFQCECTDLYAGRNCESSVYCQDHACYNTSICVPDHYLRSYTCVCRLGWQGDNCEQPMNFTSARLKNDSYLHYVDEGYDSSNRSVTVLSFSFRTTKDQSMIMWNGELFNEDKDYLGIGLAGTGHLKVAWNLGWRSSSELVVPLRLNDDNWHTVYIIRNSRNMVVKVENESYSEEVFGDFTDLDTKGLYYIGGFGLHTNVAEGTSGLFQNTFSGCFKDWFLHGHIQPIALQHVHDGLNVHSCEAVTGD